jgi:hypothetical protein
MSIDGGCELGEATCLVDERGLTNADPIPRIERLDRGGIEALFVDKGAIGTAQVSDTVMLAITDQANGSVMGRGASVIDHQLIVVAAPDG